MPIAAEVTSVVAVTRHGSLDEKVNMFDIRRRRSCCLNSMLQCIAARVLDFWIDMSVWVVVDRGQVGKKSGQALQPMQY